jgi:hypothetical protein
LIRCVPSTSKDSCHAASAASESSTWLTQNQTRLATYRQSVRTIRCSLEKVYTDELISPARLSNLLVTYPHCTRVSNEEDTLTVRRVGREISDVELSTALEIESSDLASWTDTNPLILPPLWQVQRTYRLRILQGDALDDFTAYVHLYEAWEGRLGIFKEHITELNVAFPVQVAAFSPCYASACSMANKGHPPPRSLLIQASDLMPLELSELGVACSGFLRELSIVPPSRRKVLRVYPDVEFFREVDWNSFRGIQRLSICVSDDVPRGGSVLTTDTPTSPRQPEIAPARFSLPYYPEDWTFKPLGYPHLSLDDFCLTVHHPIGHDDPDEPDWDWPVPFANEGLIPSQIAKAMLAIGGPTCEYHVRAAKPSCMHDQFATMFDNLMTNLVRREISILLRSDLDRDSKIGWRKGGRNKAGVAEQE